MLVHGRWFSSGTPASSTTKTGRHDIAEVLLKVALKHQKSKININKLLLWKLKSWLPTVYLLPTCWETFNQKKTLVHSNGQLEFEFSQQQLLKGIIIMNGIGTCSRDPCNSPWRVLDSPFPVETRQSFHIFNSYNGGNHQNVLKCLLDSSN